MRGGESWSVFGLHLGWKQTRQLGDETPRMLWFTATCCQESAQPSAWCLSPSLGVLSTGWNAYYLPAKPGTHCYSAFWLFLHPESKTQALHKILTSVKPCIFWLGHTLTHTHVSFTKANAEGYYLRWNIPFFCFRGSVRVTERIFWQLRCILPRILSGIWRGWRNFWLCMICVSHCHCKLKSIAVRSSC